MQKIVNAHCHIYPEKIADKAVIGIRNFYDLDMSLNGKLDDLIRDGNEVGVTHYLVHSVATTPKQVKSINEFIAESVKQHPDLFTGFGTMHPDSEDLQGDFDYLIELGLKGVKLHPDFQLFSMDEERAFRIGEIVSLEKFPEITFIGAHFAGWSMWEDATRQLSKYENLYVDLSSSLYALSPETALELIHAYGADRVLWGTDYPMWESVSEMEYFNKIDLTDEERSQILYENAAKLLKLE